MLCMYGCCECECNYDLEFDFDCYCYCYCYYSGVVAAAAAAAAASIAITAVTDYLLILPTFSMCNVHCSPRMLPELGTSSTSSPLYRVPSFWSCALSPFNHPKQYWHGPQGLTV